VGQRGLDESSGLVKIPEHIIKKLGPETLEQITAMEWLRWKHPQVEKVTFHIANERKQNKVFGLVMTHMGVKPGVPDLMLAVPRHGYNGLFIEMKSKKGKLSENQKNMIQLLTDQNYLVQVAYGSEQAIEIMSSYLCKPV